MPSPPVPVPPGQSVVYCSATVFSARGGANPGYPIGVATCTATTGAGGLTFSNPLAQQSCQASWSNFVVPNELTNPSTIVYSIYPYVDYNGYIYNSNWTLALGAFDAPGLGGSFNTSYHYDLGTSLASITTFTASFFGEATLPIGTIADVLNVTDLRIAIYIKTPPLPSVVVNVDKQQQVSIGSN